MCICVDPSSGPSSVFRHQTLNLFTVHDEKFVTCVCIRQYKFFPLQNLDIFTFKNKLVYRTNFLFFPIEISRNKLLQRAYDAYFPSCFSVQLYLHLLGSYIPESHV